MTAQIVPRSKNPDVIWALDHCKRLRTLGPPEVLFGVRFAQLACAPADAPGA